MSELAQALDEVQMADMVLSLAQSISRAQCAMDLMSLRTAQLFLDSQVSWDGDKLSLLQLGFTPTFYQLAEASFELKVSISISRESSQESSTSNTESETTTSTRRTGFLGLGGSETTTTTHVSTVDTRLATRFQYSATGSSMMSTRIVSIPPPALLMEVVHQMLKESENGL